MKIKHCFTILIGGVLMASASVSSAAATRLSCTDFLPSDASMWARFVDSGLRQTFEVSLKMPATKKNLRKPDRSVRVGSNNVGQISLTEYDNGLLSGTLSFDSYADTGEANPEVYVFPGGWTGPISGIEVNVAGMSCLLMN